MFMRTIVGTAVLAAVSAGCTDTCENSTIQETIAPNGKQKAILFERNCGATTDFSTQVSITASDDEVSGKGNVFIADGADQAASWGGPWAEVSWISPADLRVRYDASARVFVQTPRVAGIRVSFEKIQR